MGCVKHTFREHDIVLFQKVTLYFSHLKVPGLYLLCFPVHCKITNAKIFEGENFPKSRKFRCAICSLKVQGSKCSVFVRMRDFIMTLS